MQEMSQADVIPKQPKFKIREAIDSFEINKDGVKVWLRNIGYGLSGIVVNLLIISLIAAVLASVSYLFLTESTTYFETFGAIFIMYPIVVFWISEIEKYIRILK